MKTKLYALLAVVSFIVSSALFILCPGTVLAFVALLFLGLTAMFGSLYFESRPNHTDLAKRLTDFIGNGND